MLNYCNLVDPLLSINHYAKKIVGTTTKVVWGKPPDYQYLALCVCQLMQAELGGGCWGGRVTV